MSVLEQGRRLANVRMSETVHAYLVTGTTVDPVTFVSVETTTTVYDGPARVKYSTPREAEKEQGTQVGSVRYVDVSFPSGTSGVVKDVFISITASTADAGLVGRKYRVSGLGEAGQTTALRVTVDEVS